MAIGTPSTKYAAKTQFATDPKVVTLTASASAGDFILYCYSGFANNRVVNSVTDDQSQAYTQGSSQTGNGNRYETGWLTSGASTGTVSTVTYDLDATSGANTALWIFTVTGLDTASPFDQVAYSTADATQSGTGPYTYTFPSTGTLSQADNLIVFAMEGSTASSNYAMEGAGWTKAAGDATYIIAYKIVSDSTAITPAVTANSSGETLGGACWVFKMAAAAGLTADVFELNAYSTF